MTFVLQLGENAIECKSKNKVMLFSLKSVNYMTAFLEERHQISSKSCCWSDHAGATAQTMALGSARRQV